ncbi:MAG: exonuclease SbcD [Natronomonas sp.]|jgi:exonuclease SbcD
MTRVIHTGDTHIGYRQYHSPERRQDYLRAFRQVIDDAIEDEVDAVIHAGDLFHDRRPGLADLQGTISILRDLRAADIPFLAVVGNHEQKRAGQWLDLFEDLDLATHLGREPDVIDGTAIYGLDFVPRSKREDLDYDFESSDADQALLVSHGLFEPFAHADWDTERLLAESTVDFDALLLGDNHAPGKRQVEGAWVTYCGSTERTSASEREKRGYNIVTAENGQVEITRRGLDATREFVFVDVALEAGEGVERVREQVRQYDLEDAVVIVTVEGEGDPIAPATIEEFADDEGALVARVNDRREMDDEADVEVHFADPDAAVRERVRDLGLSEAARGVDETVRESGVAKTNVRDAVKDRIGDRLEDDPGAFDRVPDDDPDEADETGTDTDSEGSEEPDATMEASPSDDETDETSGDGVTTADNETEGTDPSTDESESTETDGDPAGETKPGETDHTSTDSDPDEEADEDAQQASMEEYL